MGLLDLFRRGGAAAAAPAMPRADVGTWGYGFDDPRIVDLLRGPDGTTLAGETVNAQTALANSAIFRSVSLISNTIGMLPLQLIDDTTKEKAVDHPLYALLRHEPNKWQTAFEFRKLMQRRALTKGNAYARVIRQLNTGVPIQLVPIDPDRMKPVQNADWSVSYQFNPVSGGPITLGPQDVLHLRADSDDGISGISVVYQAREAIGLALAAARAASRVFKNGSFTDGTLNLPKGSTLSEEARASLKVSWASRYSGADNAGKTPVLEDGLEHKRDPASAKDAQMREIMSFMIEEVARFFGVPRPLLMVDETSWGSGIDALGQFFVMYGLNSWFSAWEQAIKRTLLSDADKDRYSPKFNAGALQRGSVEAQAAFLSAALGAGGQSPWMTQNEVRDLMDLPPHADGDGLTNPMTAGSGAAAPGATNNG